MPLPFGAIGQKCLPILSTPSQVSASLSYDADDQHSFQLSSSYTIEARPDKDQGKGRFSYRWNDDATKWGYSLILGDGVVSSKVDLTFTQKIRGDLTVSSHKGGEISGSKLHLMVREEAIYAKVWYDLFRKRAILEGVAGKGPWSFGLQLAGDPRTTPVSCVLGYSYMNMDLSASTTAELSKLSITAYSKASEDLKLASRLSMNSKLRKLEIGMKYALDHTTAAKLKLEKGFSSRNSESKRISKIGMTLQKEVTKGVNIGLGSTIDLQGQRFPVLGCTLSFNSR